MSTATARAPRFVERNGTSRRPRLRIVATPNPGRSRVGFVLLCISILALAMLGALMLNTAMATTAYTINDQRVELAQLKESQQSLTQKVDSLSSPQHLEDEAEKLGMEPAEDMRYILLGDHKILGQNQTESTGN